METVGPPGIVGVQIQEAWWPVMWDKRKHHSMTFGEWEVFHPYSRLIWSSVEAGGSDFTWAMNPLSFRLNFKRASQYAEPTLGRVQHLKKLMWNSGYDLEDIHHLHSSSPSPLVMYQAWDILHVNHVPYHQLIRGCALSYFWTATSIILFLKRKML